MIEGGLLTGKYRRGRPIPEGSRAADEDCGWLNAPHDEVYDKLEAFETEAKQAGLTPAQYALKWVLDKPGLTACVIGVKRADQIESLLPGCV